MMQPRVKSYDLPRRVYCARVHPVPGSNGSTLIVYAHASGIRLLWRGGKRRNEAATPKQGGFTANDEALLDIDDDDDEQNAHSRTRFELDDFEKDEEEVNPECPYSNIVQNIDINMGAAVLHIAFASLPAAAMTLGPAFLRHQALVIMGFANGAVKVAHLPLTPPASEHKDHVIATIGRSLFELRASGPVPIDLAAKFVMHESTEIPIDEGTKKEVKGHLMVVTATSSLNMWTIPAIDVGILRFEPSVNTVPLVSTPIKLSFHPSYGSTQLLLADSSGGVSIYEAPVPKFQSEKQKLNESDSSARAMSPETGNWVMGFHSPFRSPEPNSYVPPALVRSKRILSTAWVMSGKAILVLLEDGEWGIWDPSGMSQSDKSIDEFVIRGFLGSSVSNEMAEAKSKRLGSKQLAPMTPNTRRTKAEDLFSGTSKAPQAASRGGISVISKNTDSNQLDESVVMWYNNETYAITNMQAFWQRTLSGGGNYGSLYSPGITHVSGINLMNENITSVSPLIPHNPDTVVQMSLQRDLVISAEYRLFILQNLRPATPARSLFEQAAAGNPSSKDQTMLDAGDLDLNGLDRVLDTLPTGDGRPRRVGFTR